MNALPSISSHLAAEISALKKAGEDLRRARTTNAKVDALFDFGRALDSIRESEEDQVQSWSCICSFKPWEGLIAVLTEAPDITDYGQHENEVMIRSLCAVSAGQLVTACEKYLGDHSATAYLQTQLPKILQHQAWLSINTKRWKDILYQMRQGTLHLICLVLRLDKDLGDERHEIARGLDRKMYLSLIFSHVLDPHTYTEKRGDEYLIDVVELLMSLTFDNQLSERAASWAVKEFGTSLVCSGFFKFSQLVIESGREHYFLAPLVLAAHLLASTDNHDLLVDKQRAVIFCMDIYWSMAKRYKTIDGTEVAEYSSPIAHFIHAVLDAVKEPQRWKAMTRDLIKEADLVLLLGRMWLHSWGYVDNIWIATIGKRIATLAVEDPTLTQEYIKPGWLHVQRCLESCDRIKECSPKSPTRTLDQWTAHFGRHLGWVAASDAFLQTDDLREVKLVGCSWMRCPLYGEPGLLPARTTLRMSKCRRCSKVQYCSLACQKSDWSLGDHRKTCGERGGPRNRGSRHPKKGQAGLAGAGDHT